MSYFEKKIEQYIKSYIKRKIKGYINDKKKKIKFFFNKINPINIFKRKFKKQKRNKRKCFI